MPAEDPRRAGPAEVAPAEEAGEETPSRRRRLLRLPRRKRPSPWVFMRDLPRVLPYLRPYKKLAGGSVAMIGLGTVLSLIAPWPLAILVDCVLGDKPIPSILGPLAEVDTYTLLVIAVVAGFLITAAEQGITVLDEYVSTKLEQKMVLDFRSDLFQHAQRLSLTFHDENATGGLMYRINNQADAMGSITTSVAPLLQALLTLGGMLYITIKIDLQLALLALTVVPLIYYSAGYYARRIEPKVNEVQTMEARSLSIVYEAMSMMRVIRAFGRESYEYRRFREQGEEAVDARVGLTVRQTMFSLAVSLITAGGHALVLGFGAYSVLQGEMTVGGLLIVMSYIASIYQPLEQISQTISGLQLNFIALRMALDLVDTEPTVKEARDAVEIGRARGGVTLENVSFTYDRRSPTLQRISFDAQPGQRVAVVGPTGAGKTTLISLILRFYDPEEGAVLLDGTDLRKLTLSSLRDQISVVLQQPLLFSGSILENIRYGKLDATDEEVAEAAKSANAHDFISRLPDGYLTDVGEGGAQLSGGERQRICVARAFLKDAPILILDEPTSSIDSKTEAVILDALDVLMEGRTSFMIAHRLSTVHHADFILVLNHGELVEQGTHEELVAGDGLYRELHEAQRVTGRRERQLAQAVAAEPSGGEVSPPPRTAAETIFRRLRGW